LVGEEKNLKQLHTQDYFTSTYKNLNGENSSTKYIKRKSLEYFSLFAHHLELVYLIWFINTVKENTKIKNNQKKKKSKY